jgi:hypothetical protein
MERPCFCIFVLLRFRECELSFSMFIAIHELS